jgi:muconolactone delta-isomerase
MSGPTLFFVDLHVGDVPKAFYQENGQKEIDYTRSLITNGKIKYLLVSKNRRNSMITFCVDDEHELNKLLEGFPLRAFFTINHKEVIDLAETVRAE